MEVVTLKISIINKSKIIIKVNDILVNYNPILCNNKYIIYLDPIFRNFTFWKRILSM